MEVKSHVQIWYGIKWVRGIFYNDLPPNETQHHLMMEFKIEGVSNAELE